MRKIKIIPFFILLILIGAGAASLYAAEQITGVPGSPGATVAIDGKQLPPPDPKFGGVIKEKASESKLKRRRPTPDDTKDKVTSVVNSTGRLPVRSRARLDAGRAGWVRETIS